MNGEENYPKYDHFGWRDDFGIAILNINVRMRARDYPLNPNHVLRGRNNARA